MLIKPFPGVLPCWEALLPSAAVCQQLQVAPCATMCTLVLLPGLNCGLLSVNVEGNKAELICIRGFSQFG